MPLLFVSGRKFRVGGLTGEDPVWTIRVDEKSVALEVLSQPSGERTIFVRAGGRVISLSVQEHQDQRSYSVEVNGRPLTVTLEEDAGSSRTSESAILDGPALVDSPMAGKIASLKTSVDSSVKEGQSLMVLEAMKMQNDIASPKTGIVKELYVKHGDLVKAGDKLCLVS